MRLDKVSLPLAGTEFGHRLLEGTTSDMRIAAVYFPLRAAVRPWWTLFAPVAAQRLHEKQVFVGDFNVSVDPPEPGSRPLRGYRDLASMLKSGWVDSWRSLHPGGRQSSWRNRHTGNGFRIDHGLLSPALAPRLRQAEFAHEIRESRESDHAALVLDFSASTAMTIDHAASSQ
jgi:exodeoxyribonuclease-3